MLQFKHNLFARILLKKCSQSLKIDMTKKYQNNWIKAVYTKLFQSTVRIQIPKIWIMEPFAFKLSLTKWFVIQAMRIRNIYCDRNTKHKVWYKLNEGIFKICQNSQIKLQFKKIIYTLSMISVFSFVWNYLRQHGIGKRTNYVFAL